MLLWALLRAKSIQHVVLGFDAEDVKPGLKVLGHEVDGGPSHPLLLLVALLCLTHLVVLERPEARIAQERAHVGLDRPHEVLVIEAQHLAHEVLDQDADHPDLLVGDRAAWPLVHAISAQGGHEALRLVVNHGFMQVLELGLVVAIDCRRGILDLAEDRPKFDDVLLEVCVQLVEVGDSASDRLRQLLVGLDHVPLALISTAIERE